MYVHTKLYFLKNIINLSHSNRIQKSRKQLKILRCLNTTRLFGQNLLYLYIFFLDSYRYRGICGGLFIAFSRKKNQYNIFCGVIEINLVSPINLLPPHALDHILLLYYFIYSPIVR